MKESGGTGLQSSRSIKRKQHEFSTLWWQPLCCVVLIFDKRDYLTVTSYHLNSRITPCVPGSGDSLLSLKVFAQLVLSES